MKGIFVHVRGNKTLKHAVCKSSIAVDKKVANTRRRKRNMWSEARALIKHGHADCLDSSKCFVSCRALSLSKIVQSISWQAAPLPPVQVRGMTTAGARVASPQDTTRANRVQHSTYASIFKRAISRYQQPPHIPSFQKRKNITRTCFLCRSSKMFMHARHAPKSQPLKRSFSPSRGSTVCKNFNASSLSSYPRASFLSMPGFPTAASVRLTCNRATWQQSGLSRNRA